MVHSLIRVDVLRSEINTQRHPALRVDSQATWRRGEIPSWLALRSRTRLVQNLDSVLIIDITRSTPYRRGSNYIPAQVSLGTQQVTGLFGLTVPRQA